MGYLLKIGRCYNVLRTLKSLCYVQWSGGLIYNYYCINIEFSKYLCQGGYVIPDAYLWTKKNWLNFESHLLLDPDPGIFKGFFNIVRRGIFPQCGLYLWKNWLDLHENFTTNVTLDKEVPVKFRKSSGFGVWIQSPNPYPYYTDSESWPDLSWWSSVLSDCCCLI